MWQETQNSTAAMKNLVERGLIDNMDPNAPAPFDMKGITPGGGAIPGVTNFREVQ